MDFSTAMRIIDKELNDISGVDELEFDLFGGEPFLEFNLIKQITEYICEKKGNLTYEMSMPATPHNISIVRKMAKEQGYSLPKVRNEDFFDLFDNQSETYRFRNTPLGDIYNCRVSNDD